MNETQTVNRIPRTSKHEDRATIGYDKALKRKDLLNYFKKFERPFQREISSDDEDDYKSSSTDLERFIDANRDGKRESNVSASSSSSWILNERSGKIRTRKRFNESFNFSKNSVQNRNPLKRYYGKLKAKSFGPSNRSFRPVENADGSNIQNETNFQFSESWSEGNIKKLRNIDSRSEGLARKGSSAPLFSVQSQDSRCTLTYSKHRCSSKDEPNSQALKSKHASRKKWSNRMDEDIAVPNIEFSRYLHPIKDDLNSSEILRCEELLNREKEKTYRRKANFSSRRKGASKENGRYNVKPSVLTRNSRYSKYKEIDSAAVFEEDRRRSKGENRRSYRRNNERTNTSVQEEAVTCKNNASACYDGRKEETGTEELCKLINTRQRGKWFGSLDETEAKTTKEVALKRRSEYCLCPESVDTRGCLEHLPQRARRSPEAIKNDDFPRNAGTVDNVCRSSFQTVQRNRRKEEKVCRFLDDQSRRFARKNPTKDQYESINVEADNRIFRTTHPNRQSEKILGDDNQYPVSYSEEINYDEPSYRKHYVPRKITRKKELRSPSKSRGVLIREKTRAYPFKEETSFGMNAPVKRSEIAQSRDTAGGLSRDDRRLVPLRSVSSVLRKNLDSYTRVDTLREIASRDLVAGRKSSTTTCLFAGCQLDKIPVKKCEVSNGNGESTFAGSAKSCLPEFPRRVDRKACQNRPRSHCCDYKRPLKDGDKLEKQWTQNESAASRRLSSKLANVRVVKPKDAYGKTNLKKILVYPPRGESGPPLTLYKNTSNIDCSVRGNTRDGFQYTVTYIQKFASPVWCVEEDELSSFSNAEPINVTAIPSGRRSYNCSGDFTKDTI